MLFSKTKEISTLIIFHIIRVEYGCTEYVDPESHDVHEEYLASFKRTLIEKLRQCIDKSLAHDTDAGKGKRKTVQVSIYSFYGTVLFTHKYRRVSEARERERASL